LSFFLFRQNKLYFLAAEATIIVSVIVSWQLYKQLIGPLQLLIEGAESLKERDFNVKLTLTGKTEMDELIKVYNHMTEALRKERTHQMQQHLFLEKIILTSPTGILILDYDENIHQINPRALKLLNMQESEVLNKPLDTIIHPVINQIKQLKSGEAKTVTVNGINTYKIQKSHFIDRGFARHFIMIEELTADILAAEKKAYGKVIRMMAHEVNNTIGPVNSIIQTTLASDKLFNNANQSLKNALQVAFERNKNLSIFMHNFAQVVRLPDPVKKTIDLHQLIRFNANFIEIMAKGKDIRFIYNLDAGDLLLHADAQQIEQALINVVKNSIEAIEKKGEITFTTNIESRQLTVTDNGKGIAQKDIDQLFTPFFSTKPDGQGVGLTLVKEILINHGFEFSLQTVEPGTTIFLVKLR
jgi:nitrogen fixation/metabolism regulation signal transduction histidine kinase